MARLPRGSYVLMVSLLPATATIIGVVVLTQIPSIGEVVGVLLVIAGVAVHQERPGPTVDGPLFGAVVRWSARAADQFVARVIR